MEGQGGVGPLGSVALHFWSSVGIEQRLRSDGLVLGWMYWVEVKVLWKMAI